MIHLRHNFGINLILVSGAIQDFDHNGNHGGHRY
jgi:hypothetical protein